MKQIGIKFYGVVLIIDSIKKWEQTPFRVDCIYDGKVIGVINFRECYLKYSTDGVTTKFYDVISK